MRALINGETVDYDLCATRRDYFADKEESGEIEYIGEGTFAGAFGILAKQLHFFKRIKPSQTEGLLTKLRKRNYGRLYE